MDRLDRSTIASPQCIAPGLPRRPDPHAYTPLGYRRRHPADPDHPVGCVPDHDPLASRVPTIPADARLLPAPLDAPAGSDEEDLPWRPTGKHPHGVRAALAPHPDGHLGVWPDLLVRASPLGRRIPDRR